MAIEKIEAGGLGAIRRKINELIEHVNAWDNADITSGSDDSGDIRGQGQKVIIDLSDFLTKTEATDNLGYGGGGEDDPSGADDPAPVGGDDSGD
jgi:hypothetical protein